MLYCESFRIKLAAPLYACVITVTSPGMSQDTVRYCMVSILTNHLHAFSYLLQKLLNCTPYFFSTIFANTIPAVRLNTGPTASQALLQKPNFSTNFQRMSCALSFGNAWLQHLSLRTVWRRKIVRISCATSSARHFSADKVENLVSSQRLASSRRPTVTEDLNFPYHAGLVVLSFTTVLRSHQTSRFPPPSPLTASYVVTWRRTE